MKTRIKALILVLALLVGLPVIAWTATFLYWHVTIKNTIRKLEAHPAHTGMDGGPHPLFYPLTRAGCRAIPYLVRTMGTSLNEDVQETAGAVILWHVTMSRRPKADEEADAASKLFREAFFSPQDSPERRLEKHRRIVVWWEAHRFQHHPWWRVWSSRCPTTE